MSEPEFDELCKHGRLLTAFCEPCSHLGIKHVEPTTSYGQPTMDEWAEIDDYSASTILESAAHNINDRSDTRDDADGTKSMARTVEIFKNMADVELSEEQGWLFLCCVKLGRSQQGNFHIDDYIDAASYVALAGEAAGRTNRTSL